jgi:hypothetical protein
MAIFKRNIDYAIWTDVEEPIIEMGYAMRVALTQNAGARDLFNNLIRMEAAGLGRVGQTFEIPNCERVYPCGPGGFISNLHRHLRWQARDNAQREIK